MLAKGQSSGAMHSVLIPHRNRSNYLRLCVWSILRSRRHCRVSDVEVLVIDNGSEESLCGGPLDHPAVRVICDVADMPIFNKGTLYNRGIEAAGTVCPLAQRPRRPQDDDVLSFIDADAIVGAGWLAGARALTCQDITRLCYRVRYVPSDTTGDLLAAWPGVSARIDALFARYDQHRLAYEAYGDPDRTRPTRRINGRLRRVDPVWSGSLCDDEPHVLTDGTDNPHGNSQFAIRRDALGDLRYDEGYEGRGFGDLDINRRIAAAHGPAYRGAIDYHPPRCVLHMTHRYEPDWRTTDTHRANRARYRQLKKTLEREI